MPKSSFWNVLFVKQWEFLQCLSFLLRRAFISPLSHIQLGSRSNQWTPAVLCLESMCFYYCFRLCNCHWCWNSGVRWLFYSSIRDDEALFYTGMLHRNLRAVEIFSRCWFRFEVEWPSFSSFFSSHHRQHVNSSLSLPRASKDVSQHMSVFVSFYTQRMAGFYIYQRKRKLVGCLLKE